MTVTIEWWNVAGLVADIVGFAILTWDLLPEYLEHKSRRALDSVRSSLAASRAAYALRLQTTNTLSPSIYESLHRWELLDEVSEQVVSGGLDESHADYLAETIARAQRWLSVTRFLIFLWVLSPEAASGPFVGKSHANASVEPLVQQYSDAEDAYALTLSRFASRSRLPLGWGIGLIVLGFVLQVIGSWPTSP